MCQQKTKTKALCFLEPEPRRRSAGQDYLGDPTKGHLWVNSHHMGRAGGRTAAVQPSTGRDAPSGQVYEG